MLDTQKWIAREKGNLSAFVPPLLFPSHCSALPHFSEEQLVKWISKGVHFSFSSRNPADSPRPIRASCYPVIGTGPIWMVGGEEAELGGCTLDPSGGRPSSEAWRREQTPGVQMLFARKLLSILGKGGWRLLSVGLTVVGGVW